MIEKEYNELKDVIRWSVIQETVTGSALQRKFLKGYNWADKMLMALEELKIIGKFKYYVGRKVLVDKNEAETIILNQVKYE